MSVNAIPIYLLPGMTWQYPVYAKLLPLLPNAKVVSFIEPEPHESLANYSKRMAPQFPSQCIIGGVSFGGIVAQEIARVLAPVGCIAIASIQGPSQLPPWFRLWRFLGGRNASTLMNVVGWSAQCIPNSMCTSFTKRLAMLEGESGKWHRWASSAILDWKPRKFVDSPILHLHGEADTTFPVRYTEPDIVIRHGRHALPISHPAETAKAINDFIRTFNCPDKLW